MKRTLIIAGCSCFTLLCFAQNKKQQPVPDSSFKEVNLEEVTLSASRFSEMKKYVPQQVQSVGAEKMKFMNQQTTAEMLTHTGNILVQKSQLGGGSPVIRGFEANKVLIVVDGVRMNNAIFRGGHLQNVLSLDNSILDKTEILFGPSSVLYGSDALGGVMSFYTKNPVLATADQKSFIGANAFFRYSSAYNEKTGHVDLNFGGKKIAFLSSFTLSDFGDLKQGSNYFSKFPNWGKRSFYVERINGTDSMITNSNPNKQVQTGYRQYDFLQKILFNVGKTENVLNFQYSTTGNVFRYDRLTETNNAGIAKSAEWYYGPQKRLLASWQLNLPKAKLYDQGTVTTAYQNIEESRHNRGYKSSKLNHRVEQVDIFSLNTDFKKTINKNEFNYGAEFVYNKVNSKAEFENIVTGQTGALDTRYPDGGSNTQSYAGYGTFLHKFGTKIIANSGFRFSYNRLYSKFNDKTFFPFPYDDIEQSSSALTGNMGIVFLPTGGWRIAALVSSGFRTPNVDDMSKVFESGGGTVIVPNPNLKPEKTFNYELTVSKSFFNKYQISSTVWYSNYTNALSTDFSTYNGSPTIVYNGSNSQVVTVVNKNKAYVWGISGTLAGDINPHFSFSTVINYTYGRIKESPVNYPLDHVAPVFGRTSFFVNYGRFRSELFALYNGSKDSANYNLRGEDNQLYSADPVNGFTPGWVTANLRATYDIIKNVTIQFAVENIFDKYYRVFASGLSAPGRNFVITLRGRL
ncbi:MAG: TonB-dependent receptor [Chitinophagaceae bacterium]|nr:TonB-dependent receptor [Chitinophagaceae bacterium]